MKIAQRKLCTFAQARFDLPVEPFPYLEGPNSHHNHITEFAAPEKRDATHT
jgi:hypothetical protein